MGNSASVDTQRYLDGYPGEPDDKSQTLNIDFYSNKIKSKPDGGTIEEIHQKWLGKYGLLEAHHGYIQWLFPIREDGLNHYAQRLQLHEAKDIAADPLLQGRIITSYELMLNFYGMKISDRTTGVLSRGDNYQARYAHLNRSFHNYLRITRILKCLGEVGLEHFKIHFVKHVLQEIYEHGELTNCHESCVKYWVPILRNEQERESIKELVEKYEKEKPMSRTRRHYWDSDEEDKNQKTKKAAPPPAQEKRDSEGETEPEKQAGKRDHHEEREDEEKKSKEENNPED